MATGVNLDLLNSFWKDLHNTRMWKRYDGLARRIHFDQYARYRSILAQARPFCIDNHALKIAYKLSLEPAETLSRRLILARLPFPKVWIEFDFFEKLKLSEHYGTSPGIEPGTPMRIGYLFEESPNDPAIWFVTTVTLPNPEDGYDETMVKGQLTGMGCICWMIDTLNRQPPVQVGACRALQPHLHKGLVIDENGLDDAGYPSIRHLGWGFTPEGYKNNHVVGVPEVLERAINCGLNPLLYAASEAGILNEYALREHIANSAVEQRGDARILVALLSLVNEVPIIKELRKPSGHVNMGGTLKPYLQNSIVRIDIPTKRYMTVVRSLLKHAQRRAKARHEVRGHWRTIVHKKAHERVIKKPDGTVERIQILAGELERVWVESHERGDASVGYIRHNYLVDKGKGQDVRI